MDTNRLCRLFVWENMKEGPKQKRQAVSVHISKRSATFHFSFFILPSLWLVAVSGAKEKEEWKEE